MSFGTGARHAFGYGACLGLAVYAVFGDARLYTHLYDMM